MLMLKRRMTTHTLAGFLACCVALMTSLSTHADSLQREGTPVIDGVTLIGVADGKLKYRAAAGDREVELNSVISLSIDSVPEFKVGLDAFKAGELRKAQRSLENVWSNARADWVRHFAGFYLLQVLDQRGEAVDAASIYAKLAADTADPYFLSKAPVASLEEADENQKKRIGDQIMAVVRESKGEQRKLLRAYHRQVVGDDAPLPDIDDAAGHQEAQNKGLRAESKVLLPEAVWKMLEKNERFEGEWAAIELLAKGDAAEAIKSIEPSLNAPGDLPEKLFLKGVAQLMLADAKEDQDLYRDAGLTFMRIVVHFDRNGTHPLVAPARLEVAYIHQKIGREDIYNRLLENVFLVIDDEKVYPEYRKRYYQIIGQDVPDEESPS